MMGINALLTEIEQKLKQLTERAENPLATVSFPMSLADRELLQTSSRLLAAAARALREQREAVATLVKAWREVATWEQDNANQQYASAIDQCADELEAALASAPAERQD